MAYSPGDLRREIHSIITERLEAGFVIARGWLEHDVFGRHPLPLMADRDFNVTCRRLAVSDAVRQVLRDLKMADEDPEGVSGSGSLPLPGFKHLQLGYPLERDGKLVIVPIAKMSAREKLERADRYDRMAIGCREHAEELRRHARLAA